jgi:uncharacterized protein YcbK (DUF882 family)
MVKEFSLKRDGELLLSPNFKVAEFKCKDGSDVVLIDVDFVADYLQKIRNLFQKPIIILSAYRTPEYNKKVGGAKDSYHTIGKAFDIAISGVTPKQIAMHCETMGVKGIIQYNGFCHIDARDVKYFAINDNDKITIKTTFL